MRMAAVGTASVGLVIPARSSVPSKLPKKNSLSLTMGPPNVPPKMLKIFLAFPLVAGRKKFRALRC